VRLQPSISGADAAYERGLTNGRELSLDEAVALALDGGPT
jgi:hypothetical protein